MEMSNKKQEIPAIRFNGFTDAWEQRMLGDITSKIGSGKTPRGGNSVYTQNGIPLLRSQNIYNDRVNIEDIVYITDSIDKEMANSRVEKNDVLLNITGASIGRSAVYGLSSKANVNQHVCIIRPIHEVHSYFVQLNLSSPIGQKQIDLNQAGGGREGLNFQQIAKMSFNFPHFSEQTKIGAFFKQLDDTIALHQRQLDNYKELQKSLLQKIFNQELRFKDKYGDDYPEWEKEKLGNLITEVVEKSTIQDQYPILSSTNKGLFLQIEYFKSNIASDDNIGYKILRQNEIVFSPQNLWMGNINFNDKYEAGIVSPSYKIFSVNDGIVHEFMKFMIKTQYMMNEYVLSSEQGASIVRRNLDMELFNKIKVKIPTIPEQKKITDFLIASDDQIDQVAQKLERLKEQKKGLMQRMFV